MRDYYYVHMLGMLIDECSTEPTSINDTVWHMNKVMDAADCLYSPYGCFYCLLVPTIVNLSAIHWSINGSISPYTYNMLMLDRSIGYITWR